MYDDVKNKDIWVVSDSYGHGYRAETSKVPTVTKEKREHKLDWVLALRKKYKNIKVSAVAGAGNLVLSSNLDHVLDNHYSDNMFVILLYAPPLRDIAPINGVEYPDTHDITKCYNWQQGRTGHEVECGCEIEHEAEYFCFGSGWMESKYFERARAEYEAFALHHKDRDFQYNAIKRKIGSGPLQTIIDYNYKHKLYNFKQDNLVVYGMLSKLHNRNIPFLYASAGCSKNEIADYCRKDFASQFVNVDTYDGQKKFANNEYSMFYINHLNLQQNFEWTTLFDKRLSEWKKPIS